MCRVAEHTPDSTWEQKGRNHKKKNLSSSLPFKFPEDPSRTTRLALQILEVSKGSKVCKNTTTAIPVHVVVW